MRRQLFSLAALALLAPLLSNCSSSVNVLPKSSIGKRSSSSSSSSWSVGLGSTESFPTATPSPAVASAASSHRKDKHGMPVYAFSERTRLVRTTAYCCKESDHLIYGNKNATGTELRYSNRVRSAAADWSFYPVGTVFRIKGLPYLYVVDDYGSALTSTGTIDIYKPDHATMNAWGTRKIEATVVQWGSFTRSAELLSKRTSYGHCREMLANIVRQRPDLASTASR